MTFVPIWRPRLDLTRVEEYERFVFERSQPKFKAQHGFLGVVCSRWDDEVAVLSFWRDERAVRALDGSTSYQHAVKAIEETGFLVGDPQLEVLERAGAADCGSLACDVTRRMGLTRQGCGLRSPSARRGHGRCGMNPDHRPSPLIRLTERDSRNYAALQRRQTTWIEQLGAGRSEFAITARVLHDLSSRREATAGTKERRSAR